MREDQWSSRKSYPEAVIPEGGIEIPILMRFAHENKAIHIGKYGTFVNKQVQKMTEKFDFEPQLLIGEETREEEDEIDEYAIEVHPDDEENVESNEKIVIDYHNSFFSRQNKANDAEVAKNIHYRFFLSLLFEWHETRPKMA